MPGNELGRWAENRSLSYLKKQGLELIRKNFHGPSGEIDLIMKDNNTIVFIEVKCRTDNNFYHPVEAIDKNKCKKITSTGEYFLIKNRLSDAECRFDVILITGNVKLHEIEWIKNAFQA